MKVFVKACMILGLVCSAGVAAIVGWSYCQRGLLYYLAKVQPDMTKEEVLSLMPTRFHGGIYNVSGSSSKTYVIRKNVRCETELNFSATYSFPVGIEHACIYLDENNNVVGMNYGASGAPGGRWPPKWGVAVNE